MSRSVLYVTALLPLSMLVLALVGHRPYRYFIFLRLIVGIAAGILALAAHKQHATGWMWVMIGVLVAFNPLMPLHLGRGAWRVLGLVAAGAFGAAVVGMRRKHRGASPHGSA